MEHPNAQRIRAALTMANDGEYGLISEILRPDVHWINDIGAGPYREAHGIEEVFTLFGQWNGLFDGTFQEEIIDVCGSDDNVVAIMHETGSLNGHRFDNLALFRFELDAEGRVAEVRSYDRDREAIEGFWAAVDAGATATS